MAGRPLQHAADPVPARLDRAALRDRAGLVAGRPPRAAHHPSGPAPDPRRDQRGVRLLLLSGLARAAAG
ncbi:hypothetical protein G6F62_015531 [Rhizopus arrhizus]|nr:hypothetical protein G6F62_015531 [Rhizopus arrhizus]